MGVENAMSLMAAFEPQAGRGVAGAGGGGAGQNLAGMASGRRHRIPVTPQRIGL